jgi:hypothetical protein
MFCLPADAHVRRPGNQDAVKTMNNNDRKCSSLKLNGAILSFSQGFYSLKEVKCHGPRKLTYTYLLLLHYKTGYVLLCR